MTTETIGIMLLDNGKMVLTGILLTISFFLFKISKRVLLKFAIKKKFKRRRLFYMHKISAFVFSILTLFLLFLIWSIDVKSLLVFASSFFAITGIALFAQWSILSNITSSVIIFFFFPARIGDTIRIVDGLDTVEGIIAEISMFQLELIDKDGNSIFYPNNLVLQKQIIKVRTPNKID